MANDGGISTGTKRLLEKESKSKSNKQSTGKMIKPCVATAGVLGVAQITAQTQLLTLVVDVGIGPTRVETTSQLHSPGPRLRKGRSPML